MSRYAPVHDRKVGKIAWSNNDEARHTFIAGGDCAGRIDTLIELIRQVKANGDIAIVHDADGRLAQCCYDEKTDLIFDPNDERCINFTLFDEVALDGNTDIFKVMASTLIPKFLVRKYDVGDVVEANRFFAESAKQQYESYCHDMGRFISSMSSLKITKTANPIDDGEVERETPTGIAQDFREILNYAVEAIRLLPESDGKEFSITRWVRRPAKTGSVLFLSGLPTMEAGRDCHYNALITTILELAIRQAATLGGQQKHKVWFIMDDLDSLPLIPTLVWSFNPMTKSGGRYFIGAKSLNALQGVYGKSADTIIDFCKTILLFATDDKPTALWTRSRMMRDFPDAPEFIISPHDIMSLGDYEAYLKMPGNVPIAKVSVQKSDVISLPRLPQYDTPRITTKRKRASRAGKIDPLQYGLFAESDFTQQTDMIIDGEAEVIHDSNAGKEAATHLVSRWTSSD